MKSIQEKMSNPERPRVQILKRQMGPSFPPGKMLIATPKIIDEYVRKIRKGKTTTVEELRNQLALDYKADYTCPLTTGIFLRLVAENAEMQRDLGKTRIAPYWRVVSKGGALNPKFPGGIESQAKKLKQEGVKVVRKGKTLKVME